MTNDKVKVADYIARRLAERHGVTHVFLITGGGAMHLNDALGSQAGLETVCMHHEQACAIAAEGYARISGRMAFVNVTSGPGGTNTLTGLLGQWTDSVPVLYVSGQIKMETSIHSQPDLALRQLGDQEVDITRIVAPLTKFAATLRDPKQTRRLVDKAVHLATTGRPGPVWLDVPLDIQGALVSESDMADYDPAEDAVSGDGAAALEAAFKLLVGAKRPVILAGHGIRIAKAQKGFLELVEKLGIPVLGSFNGADLIASGHPHYVGRIGTIGGRAGNFVLQNCDLLLSIGSRNNIRQISYSWGSYARAAKKVVVDIDPCELKKHTLVPDLPVQMDAGAFIKGLADLCRGKALPDWSEWHAWSMERKRRFPTGTLAKAPTRGLDPYTFIQRLSLALREGDVVVGGDGTASVAPFQAADIKAGQRWLWNSGCASMGYDLPAAIGASFALGRGPVACLAGDGSIMLNLQELETLAYQKLPVKIFLLNNRGYISIRQTQGAYFNSRWVGVDADSGVGFPDFRKLAAAFGLHTELIAELGQADAKIAAVLAHPGPVLCEVLLPDDYAFEPKLSSARLPDGRMVSKPLEDLSPLLDREEFKANMIIPILEE
ncbi:MAG TPA: thiamine pyrophosphate-binding protein [bacterium]|jgi:acetolactate synthase-1/2/3 large subunit|nr:thiamine pyrophosphate-binding protein [bacterium]